MRMLRLVIVLAWLSHIRNCLLTVALAELIRNLVYTIYYLP